MDLDDRLRGVPKPDGTRMDELPRRLGLAHVAGAEEWMRKHSGRGLTANELAGVVTRFELS